MSKTIIAWSGHRPQHIPDWTQARFMSTLESIASIERWKNTTFITGGALGVDTWAAEFAIRNHITLHIILPFTPDVMAGRWWAGDQQTLSAHLALANSVRIIHEGAYDVRAYQRRNEAMVNDAMQVFALYTGKMGGTKNCIDYAIRQQKPVYNLASGRLKKVIHT